MRCWRMKALPLSDRLRDPSPDPEARTAKREEYAALERAVARLEAHEKLLIRLRFEQDLTLDRVAQLTGLNDPQSADRAIKRILDGLRKKLGKREPASV